MKKVSAFIRKLTEILENHDLEGIVRWSPNGQSFQVLNATQFTDNVLPTYFKHNNMASFVRQLNMYGFSRPKESEQHLYAHDLFVKGQTEKYPSIKRKANAGACSQKDSESSNFREKRKKSFEKQKKLETICKRLREQNQKLKNQNIKLLQKMQEYETLSENMRKYRKERAQWVERRNNEVIVNQEHNSNLHIKNQIMEGTQPSIIQKFENHKSSGKRQSCCVLLIQGLNNQKSK